MTKKENWLKKKKTTLIFSLAALAGGFIFLKPNITGNIISNGNYSFNLVSLIGILLIACSIILAVYSSKKK